MRHTWPCDLLGEPGFWVKEMSTAGYTLIIWRVKDVINVLCLDSCSFYMADVWVLIISVVFCNFKISVFECICHRKV